MGMPLELNTMIVTKGREQRMGDNMFLMEKEGYRLYPLDIPIDVRKTIASESSGTGIIRKIELQNEKTVITYEMLELNSTN